MPVRFRIAIAVLLIAAFFVAAASWHLLTRIDSSTSESTKQGRQNALIIQGLQAAEKQRQCSSSASTKAFATILDLLADNFATPPFPDPARQKAVQGLRDTASLFRDAPPPTCPK